MEGITDSADMSLSKRREIVKGREAWRAAVHGVAEMVTTYQLNNNKIDNTQDFIEGRSHVMCSLPIISLNRRNVSGNFN